LERHCLGAADDPLDPPWLGDKSGGACLNGRLDGFLGGRREGVGAGVGAWANSEAFIHEAMIF